MNKQEQEEIRKKMEIIYGQTKVRRILSEAFPYFVSLLMIDVMLLILYLVVKNLPVF